MSDFMDEVEVKHIEPKVIFGFDGQVPRGLKCHPDGKHIIFPLGCKIGVTTLTSSKQEFFQGHTSTISCLDVSSSGTYLSSGQISYMGLVSYVILWDWSTRKEIARHDLHKVKVQSLCFTSEDKYLVSLGGEDDGSIIVYDVENRSPIARAVASKSTSGFSKQLCRLNAFNYIFVVAGDRTLRIWSVHPVTKKLIPQDVAVGKIQRSYTSIRGDLKDQFLYIGTMSGDIVKVKMNCCDPINVTNKGEMAVLIGSYGWHNPKKEPGKDCEKYVNGVRDLCLLSDSRILIGAGDGTIHLVVERNISFKNYGEPTWPNFKVCKKTKITGAVTSITQMSSNLFLIASENSEMLILNGDTFNLKLIKTCHKSIVYDIAFPKGFSVVFATASHESIRIWSTKRHQELLRIMVYNFTCASVIFNNEGSAIISAWNDGVLRAFTPITGKLIWAIPNAHNKGCSAITISSNGRILVSGGIEGQVRVWKIEPFRQSLIGVLKEHSAPISTVDFNKFDNEVVSASQDGSCVIWDVIRLTRKHVFYANTQFMSARYYPTGVQILTSGSDRTISYWEVYDGTLVRELEGSTKSSVNCVSISSTGEYFVSASKDQTVRLWDYQKGITLCLGTAHAASVISCRYSPCGKFFVSASAVGAVVIWDIPEEFWPKTNDPLSSAQQLSRRNSKESVDTKRTLGSGPKENIEEFETKRSNKDILCTECPPIDNTKQPDINETCNYIPNCTEAALICNKNK